MPTSNTVFVTPPEGWVTNGSDNCPDDTNTDQWNYDSDDAGDVCDSDDDNDGALDDADTDDNNEYECSDDDGDTLSLINF